MLSNRIQVPFFCQKSQTTFFSTLPISRIFFGATICSLFFDAYPLFPSVYKPLGLLPITLFFFIGGYFLVRRKVFIPGYHFLLLFFFLYGFLISLVKAIFQYNSFLGWSDYSVTVLLGIISYIGLFGMLHFFRPNQGTIERVLVSIGILFLVVAYLEFAAIFHLVPYQVKEILNKVLTMKSSPRLLLVNNEPSWASMTLLFFFGVFFSLGKKKLVIFSVIAILLSFSLKGVFILSLFFLLSFLKSKPSISNFGFLLLLFIVLLLVFFVLPNIVSFLGLNQTYFGLRLIQFSQTFLDEQSLRGAFLFLEETSYVRFAYPLLGIKVFENFPLGVGGGNFRYEFNKLAFQEFDRIDSEISYNMEHLNGNPKNIYSRALSEQGIIGAFLFIWMGFLFFQAKGNQLVQNLLLIFYITFLQFDSYVFLPFILVVVLADYWATFSKELNLRGREK